MSDYTPAAEPTTVAVIYDRNGEYDRAHSWETGQTYANQGYRVEAVAGDGHMTQEEAQRLYDRELADALDCFGEDYRK